MTDSTNETRYPLLLTEQQLADIMMLLDAASANEPDPEAPIFELLNQVRAVRRQAATANR